MKAYACKNKNEKIRLQSSSGGIFSLLAEQMLNEGGKVIGASFDGLELKHIAIDNINDLHKLRGSKYLRSKVDYSLLTDKVLFSGTPCQMPINKHDYLLVDIVCHGTPKTEIFKEYCEKNNVKRINFRDKTKGWTNYQVCINDEIREDFRNNEYMQMFLSDKYLNDSCYNCQFKNFKSTSDIQLGDFWGIGNEYPEFADNKGVSIVIVKTEKGEQYFNKIKPYMDYIEVDINRAIKYNPSIIKASEKR